ncbi:MAG TPA: hypothetical protein VHJ38_15165 [Nitrososphaeraceae archaeon]|jgi:hypothetical protein|nr:hypothetical protein [Nitrososphaeraceae archaeon]
MASTGCRLGGIPSLTLGNLKYHEKYQIYQVTFYENTKEEYYSFTTPECSNLIREYLDYRERCGERGPKLFMKQSTPPSDCACANIEGFRANRPPIIVNIKIDATTYF